jgi:hypothetical protein
MGMSPNQKLSKQLTSTIINFHSKISLFPNPAANKKLSPLRILPNQTKTTFKNAVDKRLKTAITAVLSVKFKSRITLRLQLIKLILLET